MFHFNDVGLLVYCPMTRIPYYDNQVLGKLDEIQDKLLINHNALDIKDIDPDIVKGKLKHFQD